MSKMQFYRTGAGPFPPGELPPKPSYNPFVGMNEQALLDIRHNVMANLVLFQRLNNYTLYGKYAGDLNKLTGFQAWQTPIQILLKYLNTIRMSKQGGIVQNVIDLLSEALKNKSRHPDFIVTVAGDIVQPLEDLLDLVNTAIKVAE